MIINTENPASYRYPATSTFVYKKGTLLQYNSNLLPAMRPFYKWQAPVSIEKLDLSLSEHRVYISGGTNEAMWPAKESIFLYLGGHLWNVQANNTVIHFFIMTYGKTKNIPKHPVLEKPVVVFSVSDGWALPTMKPLDKKEEEEE